MFHLDHGKRSSPWPCHSIIFRHNHTLLPWRRWGRERGAESSRLVPAEAVSVSDKIQVSTHFLLNLTFCSYHFPQIWGKRTFRNSSMTLVHKTLRIQVILLINMPNSNAGSYERTSEYQRGHCNRTAGRTTQWLPGWQQKYTDAPQSLCLKVNLLSLKKTCDELYFSKGYIYLYLIFS